MLLSLRLQLKVPDFNLESDNGFLISGLRGYPQSLQTNVRIEHNNTTKQFASRFFPINYPLMIQPADGTYSQGLTNTVHKS